MAWQLRGLDIGDDMVEIGAALTFSEVEERLGGLVPLLDALMPQFASRLIRNAATLPRILARHGYVRRGVNGTGVNYWN